MSLVIGHAMKCQLPGRSPPVFDAPEATSVFSKAWELRSRWFFSVQGVLLPPVVGHSSMRVAMTFAPCWPVMTTHAPQLSHGQVPDMSLGIAAK